MHQGILDSLQWFESLNRIAIALSKRKKCGNDLFTHLSSI